MRTQCTVLSVLVFTLKIKQANELAGTGATCGTTLSE